MMIPHFLTTKDITMCYREEIIQSDSPLGDMFSHLSGRPFFQPLGLFKHSRRTMEKVRDGKRLNCLNNFMPDISSLLLQVDLLYK